METPTQPDAQHLRLALASSWTTARHYLIAACALGALSMVLAVALVCVVANPRASTSPSSQAPAQGGSEVTFHIPPNLDLMGCFGITGKLDKRLKNIGIHSRYQPDIPEQNPYTNPCLLVQYAEPNNFAHTYICRFSVGANISGEPQRLTIATFRITPKDEDIAVQDIMFYLRCLYADWHVIPESMRLKVSDAAP